MPWVKIAELTATEGINVIAGNPQPPQFFQVIYPAEQNLSVGYFGRVLVVVSPASGGIGASDYAVKQEDEIWFSRRELSFSGLDYGYRLLYQVSPRSRSKGEIVQFWVFQ